MKLHAIALGRQFLASIAHGRRMQILPIALGRQFLSSIALGRHTLNKNMFLNLKEFTKVTLQIVTILQTYE